MRCIMIAENLKLDSKRAARNCDILCVCRGIPQVRIVVLGRCSRTSKLCFEDRSILLEKRRCGEPDFPLAAPLAGGS